MITRFYPIVPCPAPRQVRRDLFKPSNAVLRYRAFRDECRIRHVQIPQPFAHCIFLIPVSSSWSTKHKNAMVGMPHQQKPDNDNLLKALLDAVYESDCMVWDTRCTKLWWHEPGILISTENLPLEIPLTPQYFARLARGDYIRSPACRPAPTPTSPDVQASPLST